jgi:hypothetical protein
MVPAEYANKFYRTPRNSAQRRLRHYQPPSARQDEQQQRQDADYESASSHYSRHHLLEEEERANMTGIVRATVKNFHDPSSYARIVETKIPRTLVEQRIEFWQKLKRQATRAEDC